MMFRLSTQGVVRRSDLYLKRRVFSAGPQKKEYILRLESFGDSKKTRMQAGVNPLAYCFDKIMLDYVYLFFEEKNAAAKTRVMEKVVSQMAKERYFMALTNLEAYEELFGEKKTELKKEIQAKMEQSKKDIS